MAKKTPDVVTYPGGWPDPPSTPPPAADSLAALVVGVDALRTDLRRLTDVLDLDRVVVLEGLAAISTQLRELTDVAVLDATEILGTLQQLRRELADRPQAPPWYQQTKP
jgi:hypothetical protein